MWVCDKGFIWNPSNCKCVCDKSCNIGEYLDYKNCKCRKKLTDESIDECTKSIEEVKLSEITPFKNNCEYNSCKVYIALMIVVFTFFIGITIYHNLPSINNNVSCNKFNNCKKIKNLMNAII